jgi:hypothetical protein
MKEKIREIKFSKKNIILLEDIKEVLEEYEIKEIRVTLRQLYYQLVSRNILQNKTKEYSKLSSLLTKARYAGEIDWRSIEDRLRIPRKPVTFENIEELIENAVIWYKLDRWSNQECYVEVWTEKDALSSIIAPITDKWQILLSVNRGYASASSMHESSERFFKKDTKENLILYLGDHDPSGLDMIRDINERLYEFGVNVNVYPIALTRNQIEKYNPPPNPAKISDPRAKWYLENFGNKSWEVDALRPEVLEELIETNILKYLDVEKYNKIKEKEQEGKDFLLEKFNI